MNILADNFIAAVAVTNGQIVRASASNTAALAQADSAAHIAGVVGVVSASGPIAAGGQFNAVTNGGPTVVLLETGLTPVAGMALFVSATVAGRATTNSPGANAQCIGTVQSAARYATDSTVTAVVAISVAGVNGSDGQADWDTTLCRYYLVDYTNGLDTNVGYIDAALAATLVPATLQALALKTFEELYERLAKSGASHTAAILVRGYATPTTYYKKDGVTVDDINLIGVGGFKRFVLRGSDFTNTTADKLTVGTYVFLAGPNGDQSFTITNVSGNQITVAGGLTTGTALAGRLVRFETGALAGVESLQIQRVIDASNFVVARVTGTLAIGATFTIRAPSIVVGSLLRGDSLAHSPSTTQGSLRGLQTVGFSFSTAGTVRSYLFESDTYITCTWAAAAILEQVGGRAGFTTLYVDEAGANIGLRGGPLFAGGLTTIGTDGTWDAVVVLVLTQFFNIGPLFTCRAASFLGSAGPLFNSGGSFTDQPAVANNAAIGSLSASGYATTYSSGALRLRGVCIGVNGVTIANAASPGAIQIQGQCTVSITNTFDGGGNIGYGVDVSTGTGSQITFIGTNAVTGSLGDVKLIGIAALTWAQANAEGFVDTSGNATLAAANGGPLKKLGIGTLANAPVLAADPAVVTNGDIWIKDTGGTRTLNVRIAGTTYATVLT